MSKEKDLTQKMLDYIALLEKKGKGSYLNYVLIIKALLGAEGAGLSPWKWKKQNSLDGC